MDEMDPLDAFMIENEKALQKERAQKRPKLSAKPALIAVQTPDNKKETAAKEKTSNVVVNVIDNSQDVNKGTLILNHENEDMDENILVNNEKDEISTSILSFDTKKAKMSLVDHSKIYYQKFRKNFYVPTPEVLALSPDDIEIMRSSLDGIKVRGRECPPPIRSWFECGLPNKILNILRKENFEKPTPIQAQAIPAVMSGRDVMGIAKTGSGKTLAFVIPVLRHVLDQPKLIIGDGPISVVLTPTRELALQTTREFKRFTKFLKLSVVCVYGGTSISEQISELKKQPHIVICTPGRLIDMLAANGGRVTNLRRCTMIVLDEADRMFDLGFEPQVMFIIESIRPERQTLLFSATFSREMETLAKLVLKKPISINVGARNIVCEDVTQHAIVINEDQKFLKLLELLGKYIDLGSVLVFVERQEYADQLTKELTKYHYPCAALHGGVDQYDRDSIIEDFKRGVIDLLIATSVAARGLDVKNLVLVVNYDCPNHYEDYIHRCGRTGRAGNKGFAYTFLTLDDAPKSAEIIKAMSASKAKVPASLTKLWDDYKEEMEAAGKRIKTKSARFTGRGFQFNEDEAQLVLDRKRFQKNVLGINDDDSDDECLNIDEQIEQIFAPKSSVRKVDSSHLISKNVLVVQPQNQPTKPNQRKSAESKNKLESARRIAEKIQLNKKNVPQQDNEDDELMSNDHDAQKTASNILKGVTDINPEFAKKLQAKELAEKLEKNKGFQNSLHVAEQKLDQVTAKATLYETDLEINDFPQNVRFKITTKETLDNLMEYADIFMAVKGIYCAPKKELPDGERRLHLHIESQNEMNITRAKSELIRIIKEELVRLQNTYTSVGTKARYSVL